MSGTDPIQRILSAYKFEQPLPARLRRDIHGVKKATLLAILKKRGKYGFFTFLVITVFFQAKKLGISLSVTKSIIAAAALSSIAAGTVIAGSYLIYSRMIHTRPAPRTHIEIEKSEENTVRTPAAFRPDFQIMPFESIGGDEAIGRMLSESIANELIRAGGRESVHRAWNGNSAGKAERMIIGSLVWMDRSSQLTVKVVDARTSRITLYISETVMPGDDIKEKGVDIARRIRHAAR